MPDETNVQLFGRRDLEAIGIKYSNVHLIRLENDGRFPRRIYLSPARVAWLREEVEGWLVDRLRHRDEAVVSRVRSPR